MAMTLVSTVTIGSTGAAFIEWTNIPQTGKDLVIVSSLRANFAQDEFNLDMTLNGDTGANYNRVTLRGNSGAVSTFSSASANQFRVQQNVPGSNLTANTFSNGQIYISNYTGSTAKSISADSVNENNATLNTITLVAGSYTGTSAITSAKIEITQNFAQHSTASLYIIS